MDTCKHPPHRLYCGHARNERMELILWVACCECGEVIRNGAQPTEADPGNALDLLPVPEKA